MADRNEIHSVLNIGRKVLANPVVRLYKSHHFVALALCLMLASIQTATAQVLTVDCMTGCISGANGSQSEQMACSQLAQARVAAEAVDRVVNLYWQAIREALSSATGGDHLVGIAFDNDPTAPWEGTWPIVVFESGHNTRANQQTVLNAVVNGRTFQQAILAVGQTVRFEEDERRPEVGENLLL
jgi:hypothetical protein